MKIYFAHSKKDYDSKHESECENYIRTELYPRANIDIENPKYVKIDNNDIYKDANYWRYLNRQIELIMKKYYFPIIDRCDMLLAFEYSKGGFSRCVKEEIKYAEKIGKPVRIIDNVDLLGRRFDNMQLKEWQKQRVDFYNNTKALDFIKLYFKVKKGVRCMAGHKENFRAPSYRTYGEGDNINKVKMMTLPDTEDGTYWALRYYFCIHSYHYIFDKKVIEWMNIENNAYIDTILDSIIGMCPVLDIDAPRDPVIYQETGKKVKLDFFDHVDEFNTAISIIDKRLMDEDTKYNKMFTGNGVKIELESCYTGINGDIDTVLDYADNFKDMFESLRDNVGLGDEFKVHICNSSIPWNDYFKIPFTFHEKKNRMTVPLPKGDIDVKWLDRVSNVDNIMKDFNIINEILDNCDDDWEVLW